MASPIYKGGVIVGYTTDPSTPGQVHTEEEVSGAQETTGPATSQFSSSAMPVAAVTGNKAAVSGSNALQGKTPPAPTPPLYNTSDGSLTDYGKSVNAPDVNAKNPVTPATTAVSLPNGYSYTPGAEGQGTTVTDQNGNVVATVPANTPVSSIPSVATNIVNIHNDLATSGVNAQITTNPDGSFAITLPDGTTHSVPAAVVSDPVQLSNYISSVQTYSSAVNDATVSASASQASLDSQYQEQLQNLQNEKDAEIGAAGAATGGFGAGVETGEATHYDQLIDDLTSQYNASTLQNKAQQVDAVNTALSSFNSALSTISGNAVSTTQTAQSTFTSNVSKFDASTIQMPAGSNLQSLTIGSNGSTGVAGVDALIQQGVQAGYTPQAALQLIQAGVATQDKSNQTGFFTTLANTALANGWTQIAATPGGMAQLSKDPLFQTLVGMAQSYFPQLANNPTAASALVAGGTLATQKAFGSGQAAPLGVSTDANATVPTLDSGYNPGQIDSWLTTGDPVSVKGVSIPQSAIYNAAMQMMLGTPVSDIPLLKGMGANQISELVGVKQDQIMTAYGLSPADVSAAQAEFKGMTTANTKLTTLAFTTKSSVAIATANANLALSASQNLPRTGAKIVNQMQQFLSGNFTPNTQLAGLDTYIYTFAREYGKVTSGSAGSVAGLSDAQTSAANDLINAAQSPQVFATVISKMENDMANVTAGQAATLSTFAPNVASLFGAASGGTGGGGTDSSGSDDSGGDTTGGASTPTPGIDNSFWGN